MKLIQKKKKKIHTESLVQYETIGCYHNQIKCIKNIACMFIRIQKAMKAANANNKSVNLMYFYSVGSLLFTDNCYTF